MPLTSAASRTGQAVQRGRLTLQPADPRPSAGWAPARAASSEKAVRRSMAMPQPSAIEKSGSLARSQDGARRDVLEGEPAGETRPRVRAGRRIVAGRLSSICFPRFRGVGGSYSTANARPFTKSSPPLSTGYTWPGDHPRFPPKPGTPPCLAMSSGSISPTRMRPPASFVTRGLAPLRAGPAHLGRSLSAGRGDPVDSQLAGARIRPPSNGVIAAILPPFRGSVAIPGRPTPHQRHVSMPSC